MVVGRPEILFGPGGIKRDQVRLLEEAKIFLSSQVYKSRFKSIRWNRETYQRNL